MQVARNDIATDEKDLAAARKDSRPPGKGFTGSGKIMAVREKFYGAGRYVATARKDSRPLGKGFTGSEKITVVRENFYGAGRYVAAAGKYVAATGKWFTAAGKKVLRRLKKKSHGC